MEGLHSISHTMLPTNVRGVAAINKVGEGHIRPCAVGKRSGARAIRLIAV